MTGVEVDGNRIEAENVVVTAGPWTGAIAHTVGLSLPVQPIRHQRVTTAPVSGIPDHHPVVRVTDVSCYVRPEEGGYLYGFFEPHPVSYDVETVPHGFDTSDIEAPVRVMEEARERLAPVFPLLRDLEVAEYKQGLTTFTPDGRYLVGPIPNIEGLYAATGCASMGIARSAAVGRWLTNWVVEGDPGEDLADLSFERFGGRAFDPEWIRRKSEEFYGNYYSIGAMSVR